MTQSGDRTLNNTIRCRWFALGLGGFLFVSVFALSPSPMQAGWCPDWDVGHKWAFNQGSIRVYLDLHQNGTVITGTAGHQPGGYIVYGTVDGTVKGDHFAIHIYWKNNTTGVYNGTIRPTGRIEGTGYEIRSPSVKVNWYSETTMGCAHEAAAPAAAVKPKPATTPTQLPVVPGSGSGTAGGFIQMHTPAPTPSAEADESSSNDTDDHHGKHKKNKKKHHHHDDDENQGND